MELRALRSRLDQEIGRRDQVREALAQKRAELVALLVRSEQIAKAKDVIQAVALATQQQIKAYVEELVSLALASVFSEPYQFKADFVVRRGHTEVDLMFQRGDDDKAEQIRPIDSAGGGAVDVASFALRVVVWSLSKDARPTILLDEPFRFLSRGLHPYAAALLKYLSERMGLQIIMVTHSEELAAEADVIFRVNQKKVGTSVVVGGNRVEVAA